MVERKEKNDDDEDVNDYLFQSVPISIGISVPSL
jgi:hypothetical protein